MFSLAHVLAQIVCLCLQVLMVPEFRGWPSAAITVSFWMWSVDSCLSLGPDVIDCDLLTS